MRSAHPGLLQLVLLVIIRSCPSGLSMERYILKSYLLEYFLVHVMEDLMLLHIKFPLLFLVSVGLQWLMSGTSQWNISHIFIMGHIYRHLYRQLCGGKINRVSGCVHTIVFSVMINDIAIYKLLSTQYCIKRVALRLKTSYCRTYVLIVY